MSDTTITIGHLVEAEARDVRRCPGYYAADYEVHRTKPGKYPLRLSFSRGYTAPMPYWLLGAIDSEVVDGKTYSGFGGVNYSARDVPRGPSHLPVQTGFCLLKDMIRDGSVELLPGMEWLLNDEAARARTWDEIRTMAAVGSGS